MILVLSTPPEGKDRWDYATELDGVSFHIIIYSNKRTNGWHFDLLDSQRSVLLRGAALVAGIDLLHPYRYRAVPLGKLFIQSAENPPQNPDLTAFIEGRAGFFYQEAL